MVKKPLSWTYTITIREQDREIVILPDITSTWKLRSGDTIRFINNTKYEVTVEVNPEGWLGDGAIAIEPGQTVTDRKVKAMPDPGTILRFTFSIAANEVFSVSGGPKMVPTEPSES